MGLPSPVNTFWKHLHTHTHTHTRSIECVVSIILNLMMNNYRSHLDRIFKVVLEYPQPRMSSISRKDNDTGKLNSKRHYQHSHLAGTKVPPTPWNFSPVCGTRMAMASPPSQPRTIGDGKCVRHSTTSQGNVDVLVIFIYNLASPRKRVSMGDYLDQASV